MAIATLAFLSAPGLVAQAPVPPVYGPVTFIRQTGRPVVERVSFTAPAGGYRLCLVNGNQTGQLSRVTSAVIRLNGAAVFTQSDFNRGVLTLARPVTLVARNTMTVELNGDPGSRLTLWAIASSSCAGIAANSPPRIVSEPVTAATLLGPYAYQVVAADADHDPLTFSLPTAPSGMVIDAATGAIAWTPPGTGTLPVTVQVSDNRGGSVTQSFDVVVSPPSNRPPVLVGVSHRQIPLGVPFRLRLAATDPDPGDVLTFGLTAGPAGAAVSNAVFEWTPGPGQLGSHPATVSVRDAAGLTDTTAFTLEVVDTAGAPMLDPQPDETVLAGTTFQRALTATDPNPGDSMTFSLVSGPPGLTVAPDGLLAWTPTPAQLGGHPVKVQVTDGTGLADVGLFNLTVDVATLPSAPPVAVDDDYGVRRGTTLVVGAPGVLGNDVDPAALPLGAALVAPPSKGALALSANGGFTYTPAPVVFGGTTPQQALSFSFGTYPATYTQPIVADLDGNGVPEIVFISWGTFSERRLIAVRGDTGAQVFATNVYQPAAAPSIVLSGGVAGISHAPAVGDLDGDGRLEILAVHSEDESTELRRRIVAFNHDGTFRWKSADIVDGVTVGTTSGMLRLNLADLDADGVPEIVALHQGNPPATGGAVRDFVTVFNADGQVRWTRAVTGIASGFSLVVSDVDLDGHPDIAIGGALLDHLGNVKWNGKAALPGIFDVAAANLDDDPFGELVYVDRFGNLYAYEHTGALKWGPVNRANSDTWGLVTIGDTDGDGLPEILLARDNPNGIIEVRNRGGALVRQLSVPGYDTLGHGGNVTIFDLNGDGTPEIIYQSGQGPFDVGFTLGALHVFDGATGALLHSVQATRSARGNADTGPIVADVDGDGSAEIVTGGWSEASLMRVFRAASGRWAEARPIWNQVGYHVTNVQSDGRVPAIQAVNWLTPGLNNFRVNVPLRTERAGDRDSFTYVAGNGTLSSNVATVSLHILPPNNAPRILSTPPLAAAPGIEYRYAVRAFDPDPGESIQHTLTMSPSGMTIDPVTGLVSWTPAAGASGNVVVIVRATDTQTESDTQQFTIAIGPARLVPDVVGLAEAAAVGDLAAAGLRAGAVSISPSALVPAGQVISQDPAVGTLVAADSAVALVVSSGPAPVTVPHLVGRTESAALQQLDALGLARSVTRAFSSTVPDGVVIAQDPPAGTGLVSGAVSLTVSVGPGLRLRLAREMTSADAAIPFTVEAYDLSYAPLPAPPLDYAVTAAITPSFGALPGVVGTSVVPAADSRGAFRLTGSDAVTGRQVSADFAVTFPNTPGVRSMTDVYGEMSQAMSDIDGLLGQAKSALLAGAPEGTLRSLLDQMVQRWRQVEVFELKLATPFGLPTGTFPSPADLPDLGLSPTADDLLAQQVLRDALADLDAWIAGLREPSTSLATLSALARTFRTRAARLQALEMSEWGVIKGAPLMTVLLSDRLPELYTAIFDEIGQVVTQTALARQRIDQLARAEREPRIVPATAVLSGPRTSSVAYLEAASTLSEQLVVLAVEHIVEEIADQDPVKKFRENVMKRASWGAAAVMAASHFRSRVQGQPVTAVIAGASMSFHVFEAPYSAIEANVDVDHAANTVVMLIGPDQLDTIELSFVQEELQPLANAVATQEMLFDTLRRVYDWLRQGETSAAGVAERVSGAFQPRAEGYRGCLFDSSPECGQLFYPDGFRSVYTLDRDDVYDVYTGLPIPIILLVYDKTTGVLRIDTPVFLPYLPPAP